MSSDSEVLDIIVFNKVKEIKTEFITSDAKKSLIDLCKNYNAPLSIVDDIAKKESWETEREVYHSTVINNIKKQIVNTRVKAELNTLARGMVLQKKIYDKILTDIDTGLYSPTVKDFTEITKVMNGAKESDNVVNFNNNKILKISVTKPVEEMTYEEIIDLETKIREEQAMEE